MEDCFGGFFVRNHSIEINKELMFLSRFWGNFVSKKKEGRRKDKKFRSLEVRRKYIALKNKKLNYRLTLFAHGTNLKLLFRS